VAEQPAGGHAVGHVLVGLAGAGRGRGRVVRQDGAPVEGARLDVVSDAAEEIAVKGVAGDRFEVPGFSTLLVTLAP